MQPFMPKSMVIAVTGGIGAGKSSVTRRFEAFGVTVYDSDMAAREVVRPGTEGLSELIKAFGTEILDQRGELDRRAMRERVFTDASARKRLETVIHGRIRSWLYDHAISYEGPYCLLAIPLFAENISHYRWIQQVLLVDAPESLQLSRLMLRDGIDETLARNMLAQQASRAERLALADDVIDNSGDEAALDAAVAELHGKFLALAERHRTGQNMS
ncbi:dephospho-CoA kinase [Rhodanobacter sp. K2T2]|uniref:dephospho-CoA kinase n=1 Tax=Rhodanobacter sp. K2T2 TaxID=2723085 RepID=UPI00185BC29D|nr:dephospho-CoA kinase [Rhodanobacter sp. K2T2]NYE28095.1 dephospho-CoA kinase [Rhodanobacter sp. K2T2]